MADIVNKVLFSFRGDTSDLKAKIKDLTAEEKKLAQEQLKSAGDRNKQLETWASGLAKVAVGVGAIAAAYAVARTGFREYAESVKMEAATAGVNIDKLRDATHGLLETDTLLANAAKLNRKELGLNQQQQEMAAKAAYALSLQQGTLEEAYEAVTEALVKGDARGLKPYGIRVTEMGTAAGKSAALMAALANEAVKAESKVVSGTEAQVEALQRLGVQWADFVDDIKEGVGEAVVALMSLARQAGRGAYDAASGNGGFLSDVLGGITGVHSPITGMSSADEIDEIEQNYANGRKRVALELAKVAAAETALALVWQQVSAKKARAVGGGGGGRGPTEATGGYTIDPYSGGGAFSSSLGAGAEFGFGGGAELGGMTTLREFQAQDLMSQRGNVLQRTFGELETIEAYQAAIGALSTATASAFSAWVDGSLSAGEAVKKFFGDALKSLAINLSMKAIEHGAEALGSLASYNYAGAALHGKAAAAYAAGAIVVGAAARSMGGGGGGATGSAGGAPTAVGYSSAGFGSGSGGGSSATIIVSDPFSDDSPLMRSRKARRLFAKAGLGGNTVEYH